MCVAHYYTILFRMTGDLCCCLLLILHVIVDELVITFPGKIMSCSAVPSIYSSIHLIIHLQSLTYMHCQCPLESNSICPNFTMGFIGHVSFSCGEKQLATATGWKLKLRAAHYGQNNKHDYFSQYSWLLITIIYTIIARFLRRPLKKKKKNTIETSQ